MQYDLYFERKPKIMQLRPQLLDGEQPDMMATPVVEEDVALEEV